MDTELFNFWLVNFLNPETSPGDTMIMDNATFHKSEKIKRIVESANRKLVFLPPYSPDLNPIENFWTNFKAKIQKVIHKFNLLADAIDAVFREGHLNVN